MENKGVKLRLVGIELMGKKIVERPENGELPLPTEAFNFEVISESKINADVKNLIVKTTINVSEIGKDLILASFVTLCAFHVENFDEAITKIDDTKYQIPFEADAIIKSVSVSTTRGIIYSEVRGTFLFNMVLPIIIFNPEQLKAQQIATEEQKKEQNVP